MNQITIQLNKQDFTGGETVVGEVVVELDQDTPVRGIRLVLEGHEEAWWSTGGGKSRVTHTETRGLFDEEIVLHGRARLGLAALAADSFKGIFSKENYEILHPGTYRYPFRYVLPPDLPGDYQSDMTDSQIRYAVKAEMDLPLKFDLQAEQPLTVYEPANPAAMQPVTAQQTKKFMFDSDASVEVAAHLDKDRFYLGEALQCHLKVINRAPKKDMHVVTVALLQKETASAGDETNEGEAEISPVKFKECRFPLKQPTSLDLPYEIPKEIYPTVARGRLVKVDYELVVTLGIPRAVDVKLHLPITLLEGAGCPGKAPE
jgi:Arrestin (or S-antigen), N-terminal domain/Arrestin (or S-antigen), C-terminal domain